MKNTQIVLMFISALLLAPAALASDQATRAIGPGPGPGEGEGGSGCLFSYSIQKIGPTRAEAGETITYHVIVANIGSCRLRHIDVTDLLPDDVTYVSALPAPSAIHDRHLRWEGVELKAGRYADFEITGTVRHEHEGDETFQNTGCAFSPWIGTRICDSVATTVDQDHHPVH